MNKKKVVIIISIIIFIFVFSLKISSADLIKLNPLDSGINALEESIEANFGKEIEIQYLKMFYSIKINAEEGELVFEVE